MAAALELVATVGITRAAEAFDVPRATLYRARQPQSLGPPAPRPAPPAAVHFRFVHQARLGRRIEMLDQGFLERVQVQGVSPLHAVTRKRLLFAGHPAELDDFELLEKMRRHEGQAIANLLLGDDVPESMTGRLNDDPEPILIGDFVPVFRGGER